MLRRDVLGPSFRTRQCGDRGHTQLLDLVKHRAQESWAAPGRPVQMGPLEPSNPAPPVVLGADQVMQDWQAEAKRLLEMQQVGNSPSKLPGSDCYGLSPCFSAAMPARSCNGTQSCVELSGAQSSTSPPRHGQHSASPPRRAAAAGGYTQQVKLPPLSLGRQQPSPVHQSERASEESDRPQKRPPVPRQRRRPAPPQGPEDPALSVWKALPRLCQVDLRRKRCQHEVVAKNGVTYASEARLPFMTMERGLEWEHHADVARKAYAYAAVVGKLPPAFLE